MKELKFFISWMFFKLTKNDWALGNGYCPRKKLPKSAKTFRVTMQPCYRGFWASALCPPPKWNLFTVFFPLFIHLHILSFTFHILADIYLPPFVNIHYGAIVLLCIRIENWNEWGSIDICKDMMLSTFRSSALKRKFGNRYLDRTCTSNYVDCPYLCV